MDTEKRIRLSILIDKMSEQKLYCEKLKIENKSRFHGEMIEKRGEHK